MAENPYGPGGKAKYDWDSPYTASRAEQKAQSKGINYGGAPEGQKVLPTDSGFQQRTWQRFKGTAEARRATSRYSALTAQGGPGAAGVKFSLVGSAPSLWGRTLSELGDYSIRYTESAGDRARLSEMESETRSLFANSFFN